MPWSLRLAMYYVICQKHYLSFANHPLFLVVTSFDTSFHKLCQTPHHTCDSCLLDTPRTSFITFLLQLIIYWRDKGGGFR